MNKDNRLPDKERDQPPPSPQNTANPPQNLNH